MLWMLLIYTGVLFIGALTLLGAVTAYAGVLIIGTLMLLGAAWGPLVGGCSLYDISRMRGRATGIVVAFQPLADCSLAVVAFDAPDAGMVRFTHESEPLWKYPKLGDNVSVRYMPRDPCRACIASAWTVPLYLLLFGTAFAGLFLLAGAVSTT